MAPKYRTRNCDGSIVVRVEVDYSV